MGEMFNEAEKLAGQSGMEDKAAKDAEGFVNQETGNRFDSEVDSLGSKLDESSGGADQPTQ